VRTVGALLLIAATRAAAQSPDSVTQAMLDRISRLFRAGDTGSNHSALALLDSAEARWHDPMLQLDRLGLSVQYAESLLASAGRTRRCVDVRRADSVAAIAKRSLPMESRVDAPKLVELAMREAALADSISGLVRSLCAGRPK